MKSIQSSIIKYGLSLALGLGIVSTTATAQYHQDYGQQGYNDYNQYGSANYDDRYDYGDYQQFYDELAPYGNWMQDPTYGYVWSPRGVGRDFRPYYTNGRWAMSNMGNMWVSDYAWGSIPFHYGRWHFSDYHGWLWIPGSQWAPSWVIWRQGGGHYGWAPMGPGMNLNMNFGALNISVNLWNFIPMNHIYSGHYSRYRYTGYSHNYYQSTTIINNYYNHGGNRFFAGPRAQDVRRVIGRDITVYNVNTVNTRGRNRIHGNSITAYAPRVNRTQGRATGAPKQYTRIDNHRAIRNDFSRNTSQPRSIGNDNRNSIRSANPAGNTTNRTRAANTQPSKLNNSNRASGNLSNPTNNRRQINAPATNRTMSTQPSRPSSTSINQSGNTLPRNNNRNIQAPRPTASSMNQRGNTAPRNNAIQSNRSTRSMSTPAPNTSRAAQPQMRTTRSANTGSSIRSSAPARSSNVSPARSSNTSRSAAPARNGGGDRGVRGGR